MKSRSEVFSQKQHKTTHKRKYFDTNALLLIVLKAWLAHTVIKYDIVSNH